MIDLHYHLDLVDDPNAMVMKLTREGIYVLSVTTTPRAFPKTKQLANDSHRIQTALGLHPELAHERYDELPLFELLLPETPYVGEIGLDGSKHLSEHWSRQLDVFRSILAMCESSGGRILSIHSRNAATPVLDELSRHSEAGEPVLHWFTGNLRELDRAIELGAWFSVGPAMLRTANGRKLASRMPKSRVITETDGPFARVGGKALDSTDVSLAIRFLSEIWGIPESAAQNQVFKNFRSLLTEKPALRQAAC